MVKMPQRYLRSAISPKAGFSLVELLVAIGILALLSTIAMTAIAPMLENSKIAATKATIAQLNRIVQDRLNAFSDVDLGNQAALLKARYVGPGTISDDIATILINKDRYKAAFPQCASDLYGFNATNDTSSNLSIVKDDAPLILYWNDNSNTSANISSSADNAELMYLFLTKGQNFGNEAPNLDEINPKHIGDTDGDGRLEFLDAWGRPLRFYNAPTQLIQNTEAAKKLFATLPSPLTQDPFDPLGRMLSSSYIGLTTNQFNLNGSGTAQPINSTNYYDNNLYFAFLIVSAGPDGDLGLGEPYLSGDISRLAQPTDQTAINDNLSNRQQ